MVSRYFRACVALSLLAPLPAWANEPAAVPGSAGETFGVARLVPDKPVATVLGAGHDPTRIVVKFRESSNVRLRTSGLVAPAGQPVDAAAAVLQRAGVGIGRLERLFDRPETALDAERSEGMRRSGRELADLNLYYVATLPPGADPAALIDALNALPIVELAEPMPRPAPPPVDLAPPTASFVASQTYRAAAPQGIGVLNPAQVPGGDGANTRVVDIEYSWVLNHEDLELPASANIDTGATASDPFPADQGNHGTAVLGEIGGRANGYGVTGIAPGAQLLVAAANTVQFGYNPARSINLATARLGVGDAILIEQQTSVCGLSDYGPLEWWQPVYDAIAAATANGIVVVEAAGNGNVNLDGAGCLGRFNRSIRNSGAIIVGAGDPSSRDKLSFSSYGSRVDVQGWGRFVTTTGYGDAFNPEIRQRYTFGFSGTSSASPIVTGAVLAINGALKARGLAAARAGEMRDALVATGTAQGAGGHIGPLPNIPAALQRILDGRGIGPSWKPWESVPGVAIVGRPECLTTASGQIDCFVNVPGFRVAWNRWTAAGWRGWNDLGGVISSALSCVARGTRLHCFAIGADNRLQQNIYDGAGWSGWIARSTGTLSTQRPSCVGWSSTGIRCLAVNATGKLIQHTYTGSAWLAPLDLGGTLQGRPFCLNRAGGIDCFALFTNKRMNWRRFNGSSWAAWKAVGTANLATSPSCVIRGTALHCFAMGPGTSGPLMTSRLSGTTWSAWSSLGGTLKEQPSCIPFGATGIECFAQTAGSTLWRRSYNGTAWASAQDLGGAIASRAVCVSPSAGRIDCIAPGTDAVVKRISYY